MARRIEEEESYWPGFVDALSTIVMVVTFLLIILGVAIFAISTQVTKAIADNEAAAQNAQQEVAKSQQAAADAMAEALAVRQADSAEAEELTQQLEDQSSKAQAMAEQLQAATQTLAEQAEQLAARQMEAAELAEQAEKALAQTDATQEQLAQTRAALDAKAQEADALSQSVAELQQQAESERVQQVDAVETQAELAEVKQALEQKVAEVNQLTETVATLTQAAAVTVTQEEEVQADNSMRISSSAVAIDPTEITVVAQEVETQADAVEVTSAQEVLTVKFEAGAIDLDPDASSLAQGFIEANREVIEQHSIALWSFYDGTSMSVTQAKRTAYFRLLATRNVLLEAGFDPSKLDISVRPAEHSVDIDTVQTFLRSR